MSEKLQFPAPVAIENPELIAYRAEFPILQRKTYMNSCSLGALSDRSMRGMEQFMETWNEWGAHAWYEIWMGEIAKARCIASKLPIQVLLLQIADPPVAIGGGIKEKIDLSCLDKLANPEGTTIGEIAKACRIANKLPVQTCLCEAPKPPVAIPRIIEEQVKLLHASEVADPEFVSFQEVAKACRITGKSPVELIVAEVAKPPLAACWIVEK